MAPAPTNRPQLSYVLAATTAAEVHQAAAWLRKTLPSEPIEIVLAAPGPVFALVASRSIPPRIKLASAFGQTDRRSVRVAGAQATTGLVVIVLDCDQDLDAKFNDPFSAGGEGADFVDPATWADSANSESPLVGVVSQIGALPPSAQLSTIAK